MDKQILEQYGTLLREIEELEQEKARVLEGFLSRPAGSTMPGGSSGPDKIGNVVARRDQYQRLIDAKLDELIGLRERIEAAIGGLPPNDRLLLRLRYVQGLSWRQVSARLYGDRPDYGERADSYLRRTARQHGRALKKIAGAEKCP